MNINTINNIQHKAKQDRQHSVVFSLFMQQVLPPLKKMENRIVNIESRK